MSGLWLDKKACACAPETITRSGTINVEGTEYCVFCRGRLDLQPVASNADGPPPALEPASATLPAAFCPMCGSPLIGGAHFCVSCGAPAPRDQVQEAVSPWPPQPPTVPPPALTVPDAATALKIDNSFAWMLAFVPLVLVVLDLVLASSTTPSERLWIQIVTAVVLNSVLVFADWSRITKANPDTPVEWWVSPWWGILLVPVYLFLRSSKLKQNFAIPIVWCVAFFASFAVSAFAAMGGVGTSIDSRLLETKIESNVEQQTGATAQATCPTNPPATVGSTFTCTVTGGGGTVTATVTVTSSQGDVTWRIS